MKLTLRAAAKALGKDPATLRKYVRQGMPTVSLGGIGRGHGTVIDLEAAKLWIAERIVPTLRNREQQDMLQLLTTILLDSLKRDDLAGCCLNEAQAALAVLKIYQRAYLNITREPLAKERVPLELRPFHLIYLESVEAGTFHQRR